MSAEVLGLFIAFIVGGLILGGLVGGLIFWLVATVTKR